MRKLYELTAEFLGKEMEYACLEVSFFHGKQAAWGRGEVLKQKKGGQAPRPELASLDSKFLRKASMRIACADHDLVDLAAKNMGGGLFQKLQKLTCIRLVIRYPVFGQLKCLSTNVACA